MMLLLAMATLWSPAMDDRSLCTVMRKEMTELRDKDFGGPNKLYGFQVNCRSKTVVFHHKNDFNYSEEQVETWTRSMDTLTCDNELMKELIRRGWTISYFQTNANKELSTVVERCQ